MKDLGQARKILGMDIIRDRTKNTLVLSQSDYINHVLRLFGMDKSRPVQTPIGSQFKLQKLTPDQEIEQQKIMEDIPYSSAVGCLMYAMVGSRPDLAYAIGLVSRYMGKPGKEHWLAVQWIMRYLIEAADLNLTFKKQSEFKIKGYCDADYASDRDRCRSITGFVFTVGGNTVSWRSRLQQVVALSTTESEYIALSDGCREAVWLKGITEELGYKQEAVEIYSDSQSAIHLAKNRMSSERTKHIKVKFNYVREAIEENQVTILKIHTSKNPADAMTKVLPGQKFFECMSSLNMKKA